MSVTFVYDVFIPMSVFYDNLIADTWLYLCAHDPDHADSPPCPCRRHSYLHGWEVTFARMGDGVHVDREGCPRQWSHTFARTRQYICLENLSSRQFIRASFYTVAIVSGSHGCSNVHVRVRGCVRMSKSRPMTTLLNNHFIVSQVFDLLLQYYYLKWLYRSFGYCKVTLYTNYYFGNLEGGFTIAWILQVFQKMITFTIRPSKKCVIEKIVIIG
jgi:hypothetical protein